jgi:hypothetical protein
LPASPNQPLKELRAARKRRSAATLNVAEAAVEDVAAVLVEAAVA